MYALPKTLLIFPFHAMLNDILVHLDMFTISTRQKKNEVYALFM